MKFNMYYLQAHKEQVYKYSSIIFAILFANLLFYWLSTRTEPISDDWTYIHNNFSVEFLIARFVIWSQRIIIEIPLFSALRAPYILNLAFCALLYPVFAITLAKLLKLHIFKSFFVILPFVAFQSLLENEGAGVVTTHFNYLLPLITAMWSVVILRSNKVGVFKGCLLLLFTIFSTSNEMLAVTFMLILPVLYFYDRKHRNWYITVIAISVFHLGIFFLSGANTVRACTDGLTSFTDFDKFSLFYKLYQGTVTTVFYYTTQLNFYSLFFIFTVCYCYFKEQKHALRTSVVITVISSVVLYIYGFINDTHTSMILNYPISYMVEITTNKATALMIFSVVIIGILLCMLLKLKCNYQIKIIVLSLLLAAFAIRMTLAFSPTIFFSRTRTFFISNLLILLASCYLLIRYDLFGKLQTKAVILGLGALAMSYQTLTMTPKVRLPLTYSSSYVYNFAKCVIKYKAPLKYADIATSVNLFTQNSSITYSLNSWMAYVSFREKEILKSRQLPLLKNIFYHFEDDGDKQNSVIPIIQLDLLYPDFLKNKGMDRYNDFNEEIIITGELSSIETEENIVKEQLE